MCRGQQCPLCKQAVQCRGKPFCSRNEIKLCSLGLDGTFWVGVDQPGKGRMMYCLQGAAQNKACLPSAQEGNLDLTKTKHRCIQRCRTRFLVLCFGLSSFHLQSLDLFCSPNNDFQQNFPSQLGQSTEPEPPEHHSAHQLGAQLSVQVLARNPA